MVKTLHALPRKGCFIVFMILGQVFVMEWKSQLGTVTRMKSHLSCLYLKEGNLLRYTQIFEKRFPGNFSSICTLEISEFSVEWFALRKFINFRVFWNFPREISLPFVPFVSFPQKRNGIVFSSGVNYLHSDL